MNSVKTFVSVIAVLLLWSSLWAENSDIMQLVRKNYTPDSNIELQFEHSLYWSVREREENKSGELLLAPGEKFRFTLGEDIMVSDGQTYWQYSVMNAQLVIYNFSDIDLSYHPSNLFSDYLTKRTFTKIGTEEGLVVLESTDPDAQYSSITIKVEKANGIIKQLKIVDNNENINTYTFKKTVL